MADALASPCKATATKVNAAVPDLHCHFMASSPTHTGPQASIIVLGEGKGEELDCKE